MSDQVTGSLSIVGNWTWPDPWCVTFHSGPKPITVKFFKDGRLDVIIPETVTPTEAAKSFIDALLMMKRYN